MYPLIDYKIQFNFQVPLLSVQISWKKRFLVSHYYLITRVVVEINSGHTTHQGYSSAPRQDTPGSR